MSSTGSGFVDVNCGMGRWPLKVERSMNAEQAARLARQEGTEHALVSSLEAILLYDPEEPNERLFRQTDGYSSLMSPVPVLNLRLRNWEILLERYLRERVIRAVKLHPNYHGYHLTDEPARRLAARLSEAGVPLMVALRMEDERYHHSVMPVPSVDWDELLEFAAGHRSLRIIALNCYRNEAIRARSTPNLWVDLAFVEMYPTLADLIDHGDPGRILFGSNAPLFVARAAAMKVAWADLPPEIIAAVASGNARQLFGLHGNLAPE